MSASDTTIIYYTDNRLDDEIMSVCQRHLLRSANGHHIISVSQKPMDFGENICVGDIGRSWLSLYKQLYEGVRHAKTKYVAMAEHDCIYSEEHLNWIPPRDDTFYYNDHCWLLQWKSNKPKLDGMFSYWPGRYALSQMIGSTEVMRRTIDKRLDILDKGRGLAKIVNHFSEPGLARVKPELLEQPEDIAWADYQASGKTKERGYKPFRKNRLERVQRWAKSGRAVYLRPMLKEFAEYLETEREEKFKTKAPNLDIRHSGNFTGPKRGKYRTQDLAPWGTLADVLEI